MAWVRWEPRRPTGQPLSGYFCRVTTLVGTQRELLNTKLKTIHHLLRDCKPGTGVELPEAGKGWEVSDGWDAMAVKLEQAGLSLTEASIPFPEDLGKEDQEEARNTQAWEEPINWSPETWNLAPSWEVEQGLRRRWHKTVTKGPTVNGGQPLKV